MKKEVTISSARGVYALILFLQKDVTVTVGKLGKHTFSRGYYTYVGSALGKGASSLKQRVARHLRKEKRKFWHIDYLLANDYLVVEAVVAAGTNEKMECIVNGYLKDILGAEVPVRGFGASDCPNNCGSHLLYFPEINDVDGLVKELVGYLRSSVDVGLVEVVS